jgi:hypothetical protein
MTYINTLLDSIDYMQYAEKNDLWELLSINKKKYNLKKQSQAIFENADYGVDNDLTEPYIADINDLVRIHYLVRHLKVVTALEIGCGKSTLVIADAINKNKKEYGEFVSNHLRKNNPFELHSIETSERWAEITKKTIPNNLKNCTKIHVTDCKMDLFNSRVCTTFLKIPNVCPDFIYLDGPDQYAPLGDIGGVSTNHPDRMPMVADLNRIEPFLLPGTVILVDGRSANAQFMRNNFQQDWGYFYYRDFDIHIFVNESPTLGIYNQKELDFKWIDIKKN